jgi:hypothetical protein
MKGNIFDQKQFFSPHFLAFLALILKLMTVNQLYISLEKFFFEICGGCDDIVVNLYFSIQTLYPKSSTINFFSCFAFSYKIFRINNIYSICEVLLFFKDETYFQYVTHKNRIKKNRGDEQFELYFFCLLTYIQMVLNIKEMVNRLLNGEKMWKKKK